MIAKTTALVVVISEDFAQVEHGPHSVLYINMECVCVYFWPPAHGVCPNYEVVEFQSWTGTPMERRLCH